MLTKKQEKKYIKRGGCKCPVCESDRVNAGQVEMDGVQAYCRVSCDACRATWHDVYKLVGVDSLELSDRGKECNSIDLWLKS